MLLTGKDCNAALDWTIEEAAMDVPAFYAQPPAATPPASVGTIIVAQSDGKAKPPAERDVNAPSARSTRALGFLGGDRCSRWNRE